MSELRDRLLAGLPDAEFYAATAGVEVVMAGRADGLLHIRHLSDSLYPEEFIGVPDLEARPARGFWSDAVVAAARELAPAMGAEILVGTRGDLELRRSTALVTVAVAIMSPAEVAEGVLLRALEFVSVAPTEAMLTAAIDVRRQPITR